MTSVHAPIWRWHAGGFGQRQVGSTQGSERRGGTGQAKNLAGWKCSGNGESPQAAALVTGKGTKASAEATARRERPEGSGPRTDAQARRSESRMPARAPVTNLLAASRKAGQREARHRAPSMAPRGRSGRFAGRIGHEGHPHAGESGVGSNAGPICFARALAAVSTNRPQGRRHRRVEPLKRRSPLLTAGRGTNGSSHLRLTSCSSGT